MNWITQLITKLAEGLKWYFVLMPWEQGIRVRCGKWMKLYKGGIHFRIPYLDQVFQKNDRVRVSEIGAQTVTTRDGKTITLAGALRYRIGDIVQLYNNIHQPESTISQHIHGIVATYVANNDFCRCMPDVLTKHVMENLHLEQYGLTGVDFVFTDFVVVKTYRFITGEIYKYTDQPLSTSRHSGVDTVMEA